jgi:hypothetical protein
MPGPVGCYGLRVAVQLLRSHTQPPAVCGCTPAAQVPLGTASSRSWLHNKPTALATAAACQPTALQSL